MDGRVKKFYPSIFLSDLHLGSPQAQEDRLLAFLELTKCDNLYLVGDSLDFYHLYEHHGWAQSCNLVIRRLLSKVRKGCNIRICIGNHDAFLGLASGWSFGNVSIAREFVHSNRWVNALVTHGDGYDPHMRHRVWSQILSFLQTHLGRIPLAHRVEGYVNSRIDRSLDRKSLQTELYRRNLQCVIFGHTHTPSVDPPFFNCGDWVSNCTAVVETEQGEFHLVDEFGDRTK